MTTTHRYLIYGLVDPVTGLVRYVGKSSNGIKRPRDHLKPSRIEVDSNRHKANWINGLRKEGKRVQIRVIEEVPLSEMLDEAEQWWIRCGQALGWPLTNISMGGDGGSRCAPETREKISKKLIGHSVSDSVRRAVSESNRTRTPYTRTEKHREQIASLNRGKKHSQEIRNKISATKRARQTENATNP